MIARSLVKSTTHILHRKCSRVSISSPNAVAFLHKAVNYDHMLLKKPLKCDRLSEIFYYSHVGSSLRVLLRDRGASIQELRATRPTRRLCSSYVSTCESMHKCVFLMLDVSFAASRPLIGNFIIRAAVARLQ